MLYQISYKARIASIFKRFLKLIYLRCRNNVKCLFEREVICRYLVVVIYVFIYSAELN